MNTWQEIFLPKAWHGGYNCRLKFALPACRPGKGIGQSCWMHWCDWLNAYYNEIEKHGATLGA
jgi:hypothetical protein